MKPQRICKKCEWEAPSRYLKSVCRFCDTKFDYEWCSLCQSFKRSEEVIQLKNKKTSYHCRACHNKANLASQRKYPEKHRARTAKHTKRRREELDELLKRFIAIEYDKPMTEDEWYKVCDYFGGCALCGDEHIEKREFFVGFKDGGKYAAWNMFPMCGKCGVHTKFIVNPFIWLDKRLGSASYLGIPDYRRKRLVDYIMSHIKDAEYEKDKTTSN